MNNLKARIAALERYQRGLAPSGVALVILEENDTWAAEYTYYHYRSMRKDFFEHGIKCKH